MASEPSFFESLRRKFGAKHDTVTLGSSQRLRLSGRGIRVPVMGIDGPSFVVEMGKQIVHVCPDIPLNSQSSKPPFDYILFDPALYYSGISHTLRLAPGESLAIDYRQENQHLVFSHVRAAFRRHLQITHEGDFLVFRDPIAELGSYLSLLAEENGQSQFRKHRQHNLEKIIDIFGGPIETLRADDALKTLKQVNHILAQDAHRREDSFGNAGGVVELPAQMTPIVVGDLHAQLNNLLKILSENAYLDCLERGEAALILLGDAVHPEAKGQLDKMESSVLIMDMIFKLKLRFPAQVFFIIGNHDSFSPDVMKVGVPQSLLWKKKIIELRGPAYEEELSLFYQQSPLVVLANDFVACHAGPPRSAVSLETLVEVRQYPNLVHELTWNRVKAKGFPMGYTRGDVRRFRKSLDLDEKTHFIVAHFPQSGKETVWLNVAEIPQHHVLYSAHANQLAVFTRVQGELLPQIYPAEALLEPINALAERKA